MQTQKNIINRDDIVGALIFSAIGFVVEYVAAWIPYLGILLAVMAGLGLGYGLGWLHIPVWAQIVATVNSLGGVFLGFLHQFGYMQNKVIAASIGTLVCAVLFFWGFALGWRRDKRESDRDLSD